MNNIDLTYKPRSKHCKQCDYIIGVVLRIQINGSHSVRKLFVFHAPILVMPDVAVLQNTEQRGLYRVHGLDGADGIECDHCGAVSGNDWYPSDEWLHSMVPYDMGIAYAK